MTGEGIEYDHEDYNLLPGLFDMEAVASSDVHATLFINGTSRSSNVTVMCRDIRNAAFGQTETLFTLVLGFVSEFNCLDCIKIIVGQNYRYFTTSI